MLWIQNQKTEPAESGSSGYSEAGERGPSRLPASFQEVCIVAPGWQPGWSDNTAHKLTKSKADARLCRAACAAEKISRCTTSGDVWGEGTGGELSGPWAASDATR